MVSRLAALILSYFHGGQLPLVFLGDVGGLFEDEVRDDELVPSLRAENKLSHMY